MNTTTAELPEAIRTTADRRRLFRWLLERGINFHPDTPAADYVDTQWRRVFDDHLAARLDTLMDEAVALDEHAYEEGCEMLRKYLRGEPNLISH